MRIATNMLGFCVLSLFVLNIATVQAYDAVLLTTNTSTRTIASGWQVTNTSDTPLLPEHAYTWNAQRNHLYNPSSLSHVETWANTSTLFSMGNTSIPVRDFYYSGAFFYNWSIIQNTSSFVYQIYSDALPDIDFLWNGTNIYSFHPRYTFGAFYFPTLSSNILYSIPATGAGSTDPLNDPINSSPKLLTTLTFAEGNTFTMTIRATAGTIWQVQLSPYLNVIIPQIIQTGFLNTTFLRTAPRQQNLSLQIKPGPTQVSGPPPTIPMPRNVVYAENSNWWLPDSNGAFIAFPGLTNTTYQQKTHEVLGFDTNDITTFIKCAWINYQKPLSWEARFSQNLTVSRYSNTKYFSEMPQIAYQTSFFPVLDTFDIFNVTSNYYVAAWGQLFNASLYNRSLFQIFSTDDEFLVSIAWETSGLLNFTVIIGGVSFPNTVPVNLTTTNDFLECGLFIVNNTYFGITVAQNLVVWNLTYATAVPRELQVYGSLFRGSEVRDGINTTLLMNEISTDISAFLIELPLYAQTFFLSRYQSVSQTLTYSFDIVSPNQDEGRFGRNWTFTQEDIYFRSGTSRARFSAQSSRTTLSILYLMQIMQGDIEYDRAEIYNRTNYHTTLAGRIARSSVRIALSFQYVMLTIDYIVPLSVQFEISLTYFILATARAPRPIDVFLGAPALALLAPVLLLVLFPWVFFEATGRRKIFAGIGFFVGIIVNAVVGLIDPVMSVLFALIAGVIVFLMMKRRENTGEASEF